MTARDDLDELHALAESISEEATTWRERRHQRLEAVRSARLEARLAAPVRRRVRHRRLTAAVVAVVVLVTTVVLLVVRAERSGPAHHPDLVATHLPDDVRVGRAAAQVLNRQGLAPSVFTCQSLYDTDGLGTMPGQEGGTWRAGYLAACAGLVTTGPGGG